MEDQVRQRVMDIPSLEEAFSAIKEGLSRRRFVLIVGNCRVDYHGRASSKLDLGERLLILKPDGSALIHRSRDHSPVNWQPPGSLFRTRFSNGELLVRIYRRKDNEVLEIFFNRIMMLGILDLKDAGAFSLYATEKDMQEAILFQPSLLEEGFRPISPERPVEPGFIDIMGVDREGILTLVEIKRKRATRDSVAQLKKYVDVINLDRNRRIRAILVAPELAKGAQELLMALGYEFKAITPKICSEVLKLKNSKSISDFFK
jgi:RecB family endonuclease NucS